VAVVYSIHGHVLGVADPTHSQNFAVVKAMLLFAPTRTTREFERMQLKILKRCARTKRSTITRTPRGRISGLQIYPTLMSRANGE
jgi:hypothetical protein